MERVPMTIKGAEALRAELKHLKQVNRPRIVEAISTARAHGDLSENAEYHAAKEEQGFNEGRIKDLEDKLAGRMSSTPLRLCLTGSYSVLLSN